MKSSTLFLLIVFPMIFSNTAYAEYKYKYKYGIGSTITNGLEIFIPIRDDRGFFEFSAFRKFNKVSTTSDSLISEDKTYGFSVARFITIDYEDKTSLYYGGRLGYKNENHQTSKSFNNIDTYYLAPTIGVLYDVTSRLSFALDVAIVGAYSENKISITSNSSSRNIYSNYTETKIIIRFMM